MQRNPTSVEQQFFGESNQRTLYNVISQEFNQVVGSNLNGNQSARLAKTIGHYMQEVWDYNGPMPIKSLNQEVLTATSRDFNSYLRRAANTPSLQASEKIVSDPANQPRTEVVQQQRITMQTGIVPPRPTFENNLLMDTGSRFEQLQQERIPAVQSKPNVPEFQISLTSSSEEPSAISLYERAKKMRDEEFAKVQAAAQPPPQPPSTLLQLDANVGTAITDANPLVRFISPPSVAGDAQANPTISQPIATIIAPQRGPLPQDYLIKQDDIITYKETEYNLIVYSADRDWLSNTRENRYAFSVNFDVGNNKQGFYHSPTATKKFRNITRIELVKAIMPSEGLTTLVQSNGSGGFNTNPKLNILSFPYIIVRIPELDNNNYGTDNFLDNAFGVLQYDANWYTDTTNLSDGYFGMIPKFMKCQKVYTPTPLATLQKLSIELQRPNGELVSDTSDVVQIQSVFFANTVGGIYTGSYATADYIVIQTSNTNWFNHWAFTEGNTIQIKGLVPSQIINYSSVSAAADDFIAWLQRENGHIIIGNGNSTTTADGPNSVGYGNLIIIRNRFQNPTSGSTSLYPFGNAPNNTALGTQLAIPTLFQGAALINLTHQTNIVFRIITREMDPTARVRPDNL
jgi:hypothetical protein